MFMFVCKFCTKHYYGNKNIKTKTKQKVEWKPETANKKHKKHQQ